MYSYRSHWPYILCLFEANDHATLLNCRNGQKKKLLSDFLRIKKEINKYINKGRNPEWIDAIIVSTGQKIWGTEDISSWRHYIHDKDVAINQRSLNINSPRYKTLIETFSEKKVLRLDYIQAINTPSSAFTRTEYVKNINQTKKIAFLGDDDCLSMIMPYDSEITVFDKDKELIRLLRKKGIYAHAQDFLLPFSSLYHEHFDIVYCDPPYAENWIHLFLTRSVEICRIGGIISVAYYEKGREWLLTHAKSFGLELIHTESTKTTYFSIVMGSMNYFSKQYYFIKTKEISKRKNFNKIFEYRLEKDETIQTI